MDLCDKMREDAAAVIAGSLKDVLPDRAVEHALSEIKPEGDIYVAAFGKAAWQMAAAARRMLDGRIKRGVVVTKYGHSKGELSGFAVMEAGHPVPDENSIRGAEMIMEVMGQARACDTVILLVSGGGSSLLEKPEEGLTLSDIRAVTEKLLQCGAAIQEINVLRKRLSAVKGGKLALACQAKVYQIVLSDIIDDNLEMIASGPACADTSTYEDVVRIKKKYGLHFSEKIERALKSETPGVIDHVESVITGSVRELCRSVAGNARARGYEPFILTTELDCEAREAGKFMAAIARGIRGSAHGVSDALASSPLAAASLPAFSGNYVFERPCAIIAGGETVVNLTGHGKGGRNQELALSAARGIEGLENTVIFSVGSDGTDGPTDAAGGIVDGRTMERLREMGIDCENILRENDSYHALKQIDSLIMTGATGTNVNDVTVVLCR